MLKGSQEPNMKVTRLPKYKTTDGDDAEFLAAGYGLTPDPWQKLVLDHALGRTAKGEWAASQVCVAVPRQNGKNAIIEMIELYQTVVLGRKILHTAHQVRTSRAAFLRIAGFFDDDRYPELKAMCRVIRRANGQEAVELTNGGQIIFSARSQGAARGMTVDTLVMDEAQDLGDEVLAALLPTISSAPSGEPQQVITGTPPTTKSDGEVWKRLRESAQERAHPRMMWAEWSAPDDGPVDLGDERVWAAANPALGFRLQPSVISDELAAMEPGTFMRERLGMWTVGAGNQAALPLEDWALCADREVRIDPEHVDEICLSVDLTPSRDSGAIVAAIKPADGSAPIIDVIDQRAGSPDWIVPRVGQIVEDLPVSSVVIDSYGPAASLITLLENRGVGVTRVNVGFVVDAAERLRDAVVTHALRHLDQAALKVAIAGARQRKAGGDGRVAFGRLSSATDISPLVAASLAFGGLAAHGADLAPIKYRKKKRKGAGPAPYRKPVRVM